MTCRSPQTQRRVEILYIYIEILKHSSTYAAKHIPVIQYLLQSEDVTVHLNCMSLLVHHSDLICSVNVELIGMF